MELFLLGLELGLQLLHQEVQQFLWRLEVVAPEDQGHKNAEELVNVLMRVPYPEKEQISSLKEACFHKPCHPQ